MTLKDQQLNLIKGYLHQEGVSKHSLQEDLIDHFSCAIEEYLEKDVSFTEAFDLAKERIAPDGVKKIEEDLIYLLTVNHEIMLRKIVFILGYISILEIIMAFALYLPGSILTKEVSGYIAMGGIALFAVSVVPFYCYQLYKKSIHQLKES
ncbi:hypothetical protein [uncultured Croceitalea sp.]|uniref:hypothetical protein n=1 Tax=uncultured Croceitalea sp. TaxID=1798908 RepID=UPI00330619FD